MRRAHAFALIALAAAIAVCGLGHRLSAYLHYGSQLNRATVTRLWLEPRNNAVAAIHRIGVKHRSISDSQPLPASAQRVRRIDTFLRSAPPVETCRPVSFRFLIPFRSPPSHRFSLA